MLQTIGEIFLKYWVEFILAGIATAMGIFVRNYIKMNKDALQRSQKEYHDKIQSDIIDKNQEMIEEVLNKSKQDDQRLQNDVDLLAKEIKDISSGLNRVTQGVLSLQGDFFKKECRMLLEDSHEITLDEWEQIEKEHTIYNSLGGNHKGDELYNLVKERAKNHITK